MNTRNTDRANIMLSFGPFRLAPARRILSHGDKAVALGSRAMDILLALVENAGDLVTKEQLMTRVWPTTKVVEDNVSVHIAALRRALGDGKSVGRYVMTIPGRGYRFVAPVIELDEDPPHRSKSGQHRGNVMPPMASLIGRDAEMAEISRQLEDHRLVTITGPGGIGKSALALAVARQASTVDAGAWVADLSSVDTVTAVQNIIDDTINTAYAETPGSSGSTSCGQGTRLLLLLDNCEHFSETVAEHAHSLLRKDPALRILATSREPLRIENEVLYRLRPLAVPVETAAFGDSDHLGYAAIQLFVERARIDPGILTADAEKLRKIADICRELDGLPLAIELACDSLDSLGLAGLEAHLGKGFDILAEGKRTAPGRHVSLRASADWSYGLLSASGKNALQRLAIFEGAFSMDEAVEVMECEDRSPAARIHNIASLVDKSLLLFDVSAGAYRMMSPTRIYALDLLKRDQSFEEVSNRRAKLVLGRLNGFCRSWRESSPMDWPWIERGQLGDLRASLDWAFAAHREPELGLALTIASIPFLLPASREECRSRLERAMAELDRDKMPNAVTRTKLRSALVVWVLQAQGLASVAVLVWCRTLELADGLADQDMISAVLEQAIAAHLHHGGRRDPYAPDPLELVRQWL